MWLSRTWFLVALLLPAALVAGALSLPATRDAAVTAARDRAAEVEAQVVVGRASAELTEQRNTVQLMAQDPRLRRALQSLAPEMPPHIRRSVIDGALEDVAQTAPRLTLVWVDAEGTRLAATTRDEGQAQAAAGDAAVKQAMTTQALQVGHLGGDAPRTLLVAPVPGDPAPLGALAALAQPPAGEIARAHAEAGLRSTLVVFAGESRSGSADAEAQAAIAEAAPALGDRPQGAIGALTLDGAPHHARRFAVPSAPGVHFALAWPIDPPTTLDDAGGLAALPQRAAEAGPVLGIAVGGALLLWLIGVLIGGVERARAVKRLADELALAGNGETVDRGRHPGWLQPLALAAIEAGAEARRARARRGDGAPPAKGRRASLESSGPKAAPPMSLAKAPADSAAPKSAPADSAAPKSAPADSSAPKSAPADSSAPKAAPADSSAPKAAPADSSAPKAAAPRGDASGLLQPPPSEASSDGSISTVDRAAEDPRAEGADINGSLFDMQLPTLDDDDLDEPEDNTDGDIRLPGSSPPAQRRPAASGGLLDQLRSTGALEPERRQSPEERTAVRAVPLDLLATSRDGGDPDRTVVGPPPTGPRPGDALERYYRQVFDEFVATKEACDESIEGLDYKRFRAKLVRTRKSLLDRFECVDVRFRVYVKDGKAALKAAPVLDEG